MPVTTTISKGLCVGPKFSLTISHTSDAHPLYVLLSWWVEASAGTDDRSLVSGITFNGVALTRCGHQAVNGNTMEWWRLEAPDVTTANVVLTLLPTGLPIDHSTGLRVAAAVLNLSGWPSSVDLHTFSASGGTYPASSPSNTVSSALGSEVIDWLGFNFNTSNSTPGAGQTELWTQDGLGGAPANGYYNQQSAGSLKAGATPTVSTSWSLTHGTDGWGLAALSFLPEPDPDDPDPEEPDEPSFTDAEVSHPLAHIALHLDAATYPLAEVDLNDAADYYDGYKRPLVLNWKAIGRGLSDRSGQLEHLAYGATFSDTSRFFRGLLADEETRYFPNRLAPLWLIDDEDRRAELPWRLTANGFLSSYSPDPDLKFSIDCVDWVRKKYTRQRRSQLSWQPLIRPEDFDVNTTPPAVLNRPAPFPYNPHRDDDLQTVLDNDRTTGYLPDPTAGGPTLTGSPANAVTKRFYFTAMNGFYGDPALQKISDHRGETYYDAVDQSVPDDQELRDQVNGGAASVYCTFPITATDAAAVRVYAGDTNGANIRYLGLADDLGGGSFSFVYGRSSTGGPLYTAGEDAKVPTRNNTYLPGTLTGGTVTTDPGSGTVAGIYTGIRLCTDGIYRSEFLFAACAVAGDFVLYTGGVRLSDTEMDDYFAVPGRATWTSAFDAKLYLEVNGRRYTTIEVDRGYAIANGLVSANELTAGETPLAANFDGIEDVGDGTGDEITNLFLQALHFAENAGPPDRPINAQGWVGETPLEFTAVPGLTYVDRDSFAALAVEHPDFDGDGIGGVIGAFQEEVGFTDVLARFHLSGDFQTGFNRKGQLIASREPEEIPDDLSDVDDVISITERSFRVSDGVLSDFFNVLPYRYGRDLSGRSSGGVAFKNGVRLVLPETDGWQSTLNGDVEVTDTASQYHFDQIIAASQMDLHFLSDQVLARQVANRVLRRYSFPLRTVTFTVPLSGTSIDLGDIFALTHIEGIGADGFLREPLRCVRHELDCNQNAVTITAYAISTLTDRIVADETFDPITTEDGHDYVIPDEVAA